MSFDPFRAPTPTPLDIFRNKPGPSLRSLIGQPLTITLTDGRILIGYFTCVDKQCNIILSNAEEFRPAPASLQAKELAAAEGLPMVGELAEETKEEKVWRNRERYWPKSEPFGGYGTGWGGRGLAMVCLKKEDVVKVEIEKEAWKWMGGQ